MVLTSKEVASLTPNWTTIADALGKEFDFAANCYETGGLTRQIGTAQNGSDPESPVVLCIPAGHFYQSTVHYDRADQLS